MNVNNSSVCNECNSTFKRFADLRKHVKKFHSGRLQELAPLETREFDFTCGICHKNFNHQRNLQFHMKTHALDKSNIDVDTTLTTVGKKKCPLCDYTGKFKTELHDHFKSAHNIVIESEVVQFSKSEEFSKWFIGVQKDTQSKFVKEKGATVTTTNYVCHRSGFFNPQGTGKRHIKMQGSSKINGFCPARIKVCVGEDDTCKAYFIKTHVGHQNDLGHLFLSAEERNMLATQIAAKIPFDVILDSIRDGVCTSSLERIHLLNKKDLFNIASNFNLQSAAVRHKNDGTSVDAWVEEKKDSCVLFYKPQGSVLEEHLQFKDEDFILVIMTEGQKSILNNFAEKCICIDGTHGLNGYNFELHTLLVLDDLHQGFPCAFCISNRSDEMVMKLFFCCIRKEVGQIKTRVFMSDMAETYFNGWMQVMLKPQFRLFCSWHVDRAWRKHLPCINSKDKQVEVYKVLRTLLQEVDASAFERMMPKFLEQLTNDPDTSAFGNYFATYYMKNAHSWAYCYRVNAKLNTNMHIERMHHSIKYIYLHGKHVKRLDKAIDALMRFVKDKLFDRLIFLHKGKVCYKLKELRKRHQASLSLKDTSVIQIDKNIWQIPSASNFCVIYTIHENDTNCDCQLVCSDCNVCIHRYDCDCIDSSIRWNMCKHIHLLCAYRKNEVESCEQSQENIGMIQENEGNLAILENRKIEESEVIFKLVKKPGHTISFLEKKKAFIEEALKELHSISNDEELVAVQKIVNPVGPTLRAIRQNLSSLPKLSQAPPHNQNISQQRRLFSTKKKLKKTSRIIEKPNVLEQNTLAVSLLN